MSRKALRGPFRSRRWPRGFVTSDGKLSAPRDCLKMGYVTVTGLTKWSIKVPRPKAGVYMVWSRAISTTGTVELKARPRNYQRVVVKTLG